MLSFFLALGSILMILVPLLVFGVMYFAMFDQDQSKLGLCGLGAVVSVNAVIISYVLMAWNEKVAEPVSPKND